MAVTQRDLDLMAWTLLGEAAGEGKTGMQAVANVIVNRANSGRYPSSIRRVVLQPKQFSTWNTGEGGNNPTKYSKNSDAFKQARAIAEAAVTGQLPDITGGALNYWSPKGMKGGKDPKWARGVPEDQRLKIGNHVFLTQHPVPPGLLTSEAPTPATMSPELAYARSLSDPAAALAAIQSATGSERMAGLDAYAPGSGELTTVSRPTYSVGANGVPFTPDVAQALRTQIGTQPDNTFEDRLFGAFANAPKPSAPAPTPVTLKDIMGTPAPMSNASILDELSKSSWGQPLAASTDPSIARDVTTILQRPDGSSVTVPRAGSNQAPIDRPAGVGIDAFRTPVQRQMPLPDMSDPAYTPKIFGSDAYSPYMVPGIAQGSFQVNETADRMRNNTSELPYETLPRLNSPGYDTAVQRTIGSPDLRALDMAMSPRQVTPNASAPRPVTNLIAAPSSMPGMTGFGMNSPGALPAAAAAPSIAASVAPPQIFKSPTPAEPVVNRKGYYVGNPYGNYEVARGQTLAKVAKQFGTDVDTLAAINNIPNPSKISTGAKLFIPQLSTAPVAARSGMTATPTGGTVTPAQRTAISSSSGGSSTPVSTYKAPTASKPATTSQPVSLYNPIIKTPTVTTPTGSKITQAQMNAIRGLATGGPVQKYAGGSSVTGGGTALDPVKLQAALQSKVASNTAPWLVNAPAMAKAAPGIADAVDMTGRLSTLTLPGAIANTLMSDKQKADMATAARVALLKGVSATNGGASSGSRSTTPMMDGSPSSVSYGGSRTSGRDAGKNSTNSSSGGIDGVIGTYNPPTMAQINAMYAPYMGQAVMPPAGYNPGISGEWNYFPTAAATTPGATPGATPAVNPSITKATDWFNTYAANIRDRAKRDAARKVMADDKTSYYDLFHKFRDSLGHNAAPSLESWTAWLGKQGYATGGSVSEPRLVLGKGGPTADKIPATIDGKTEARLSNGEFVMTAAAVRGLGGGDYGRGAEALMRLNDQFDPRHNKGTLKVERVR